MSRRFYKGEISGMKDPTAKREPILKAVRDHSGSSSNQGARGFYSGMDSSAVMAAKAEKLKRAEESLRTVMYLSCWGPN